MKLAIHDYSTIIFDCDGVILDSNKIKSEAFRIAASPWGARSADELVDYHVANGGVSRYLKFSYFLSNILPGNAPGLVPGRDGPDLSQLLASYTHAVKEGLHCCQIADGLDRLRSLTSKSSWMVVSGGDQSELQEIFARRGIASYFDGGIFGSPDTKDEILSREISSGTIIRPAVFLGDSRYDHQASARANIDFVFVSCWTEFEGWQDYLQSNGLPSIESLCSLID